MRKIFIKIKKGLLFVGQTVQKIVNILLLAIVYFIGVGITALFAKLFGKSFLFLSGKKDSYWDDNKVGKETLEEGRRLF